MQDWCKTRETTTGGPNSQLRNALFNDIEPAYVTKKEKPVHRRCAHLAAVGYNVKEIAAIVEMSPITVSNILRQPYAREATINAIKEDAAAEQIKSMLESAAPSAVKRIMSLAESKTGTELGFKADLAIVERFMGKPVQPVSQAKPIAQMSDAELEASIRADENRLSAPSSPEQETEEYK
jgi:hypothetical protein